MHWMITDVVPAGTVNSIDTWELPAVYVGPATGLLTAIDPAMTSCEQVKASTTSRARHANERIAERLREAS